ncbi:MAG: FAD-dependent oxidoreductase [Methanoregula sp.]|nr:MAG: FAD-dependent oxidoreductase [Methanoregula sp.]
MQKVSVYSTKNCPYCRMTKAFLDKNNVPYTSIDVGDDVEAAKKMVAISGQRGVPVITVNDEIIVGFDSRRLNELFGDTEKSQQFDVLIVGAGPAGLTAGMYCARKMLKTVIISENIGGQALQSWAIENYMGYRMVTGEDLMKKFEEQARSLNIQLELDGVEGIAREEDIFTVKTATGATYSATSIILAQGNHPKNLGVSGEEKYLGRGLSVCSTCDGPLYQGKKVAVVGGGNSALQTAVEMSSIAASVSLIVRKSIRADEVYLDMLKSKPSIMIHMPAQISALHGDGFLTGITIRDDKGAEQTLKVDGLFVEIGWQPNTLIVKDLVTLNERGEVAIDINCHTSVPGIFAAGDVTSVKSKQIVIAAGEGAKAALEAHGYVMRNRRPDT